MPIPVFDLHCDTADRLGWQTLDSELRRVGGSDFYGENDKEEPQNFIALDVNGCAISLDKIDETPWAQCFATFIPDCYTPEQAIRFHAQIMAHTTGQVNLNHEEIREVRRASDIRPVLEAGGIAAVHTIENARLFAADLSLIEMLKRVGVLMASLSWNAQGPLASGHDSHAGLTPAGVEALAEMERASMILDVSHLNDECFAEVTQRATRPFIASHSNSRTVCGHPRNLTDDQFRTIRDRGGVVGLNYCGEFLVDGTTDDTAHALPFEALAAHVEHWLELGGEDVIALGGDLDGAAVPEIVSDASKFPSFQQQLVERFGESITRKLCYENALAFFERF